MRDYDPGSPGGSGRLSFPEQLCLPERRTVCKQNINFSFLVLFVQEFPCMLLVFRLSHVDLDVPLSVGGFNAYTHVGDGDSADKLFVGRAFGPVSSYVSGKTVIWNMN